MGRVFLLGFVVLTMACGGKTTFPSLCETQVPPPESCNAPCDPAPGGTDACTVGYHCSSEGKCDTQCTAGGGQCGRGYECTDDGHCVPDGTGSGTGGDPDACPSVHFTVTKTTPSIQLLIDRSGSMLRDFDNQITADVNKQKFTAEQDALVGPEGVVTQLQAGVYFGASMYPSDVCPGLYQDASGRQLNNKAAIDALLTAHVPEPNADTPTSQSIDLAVADFVAHPPPQRSPPVIVLATDGIPNACPGGNQNAAKVDTVTAAATAFSHGIRLFLLSVGTQIDDTFKRQLANAGQGVQPGQPDAMAYTATDPASLAAAFQAIIGGVLSCDLTLNGHVDPDQAAGGSVVLNGAPLIFNTDWTIDANGTTIHLLGNACITLKSAQSTTVDATFSCGAVIF